MKEHPIPFNAEMVRAILDGRKTQTRRPVKHCLKANVGDACNVRWCGERNHWQEYAAGGAWLDLKCPHGVPGDRLWVRETHRQLSGWWGEHQRAAPLEYRASWETRSDIPWRRSIHMPRWASRITLEVTAVRVERVQDVSEADAKAEGITPLDGELGGLGDYLAASTGCKYKPAFSAIWDSIYTKHGFDWDANPWVWVVEFRRLEG